MLILMNLNQHLEMVVEQEYSVQTVGVYIHGITYVHTRETQCPGQPIEDDLDDYEEEEEEEDEDIVEYIEVDAILEEVQDEEDLFLDITEMLGDSGADSDLDIAENKGKRTILTSSSSSNSSNSPMPSPSHRLRVTSAETQGDLIRDAFRLTNVVPNWTFRSSGGGGGATPIQMVCDTF